MTDNPACVVSTYSGKPCTLVALAGVPCCWDHASRWATADFGNLRRFVTPRANQVGRIYIDPDGRCVVHVRKRVGAPAKPHTKYAHETGFCGLHLDVETATVCADVLASLGNAAAAELILMTIARIGN